MMKILRFLVAKNTTPKKSNYEGHDPKGKVRPIGTASSNGDFKEI